MPLPLIPLIGALTPIITGLFNKKKSKTASTISSALTKASQVLPQQTQTQAITTQTASISQPFNLMDWIKNNLIVVAVVVAGLLFFFKRKRK